MPESEVASPVQESSEHLIDTGGVTARDDAFGLILCPPSLKNSQISMVSDTWLAD